VGKANHNVGGLACILGLTTPQSISLTTKKRSAQGSLVPPPFFLFFESTQQLVRRVHPKCTQVVCSNKVGRSRLAQRHSRNGPRAYEYSFDVNIHIFFFKLDIRIRRHTNNRGREQNTNEQGFLVCYAATQLANQLQQTRIIIYSRHSYTFKLEMVLMRTGWNITQKHI